MRQIYILKKECLFKNSLEYIKISNQKVLEPFEVHNARYEEVDLLNAIGRISKDFIVPYPPGVPIVLPGEKITKEVVQSIKWYQNKSISILGIYSNIIKVVLEG